MDNKKQLDKIQYNEFVQSVDIQSINLLNLNIKSSKKHGNENDNLIVNLEFKNNSYVTERDIFKANPVFITTVSDSRDDMIVFEIEIEYELEYIIKNLQKYDTSYLELFLKRNIPVNIWPYARELISSMTTRMGYSALVIEPLKG